MNAACRPTGAGTVAAVRFRAIAERLLRRGDAVRSGAYELRVQVLHPGTRSEGRIGRLFRDGVEVEGAAAGEVVDAGPHRFLFHGHERPHLWSTSGWAVDADRPSEAAADDDPATPAPGP